MKAKSATKVSLIKSVKGEFRTRSSASPTSAPLLRKRSRRYSELDLDQKSMVRIYIYTHTVRTKMRLICCKSWLYSFDMTQSEWFRWYLWHKMSFIEVSQEFPTICLDITHMVCLELTGIKTLIHGLMFRPSRVTLCDITQCHGTTLCTVRGSDSWNRQRQQWRQIAWKQSKRSL